MLDTRFFIAATSLADETAYLACRQKNTTRPPAPCLVWWCLKFPPKRKNFSIHNTCGDFVYNLKSIDLLQSSVKLPVERVGAESVGYNTQQGRAEGAVRS